MEIDEIVKKRSEINLRQKEICEDLEKVINLAQTDLEKLKETGEFPKGIFATEYLINNIKSNCTGIKRNKTELFFLFNKYLSD